MYYHCIGYANERVHIVPVQKNERDTTSRHCNAPLKYGTRLKTTRELSWNTRINITLKHTWRDPGEPRLHVLELGSCSENEQNHGYKKIKRDPKILSISTSKNPLKKQCRHSLASFLPRHAQTKNWATRKLRRRRKTRNRVSRDIRKWKENLHRQVPRRTCTF